MDLKSTRGMLISIVETSYFIHISEGTIKSCLRLCRRYEDYKNKLNNEIVSSIIKAYGDVISYSKSGVIKGKSIDASGKR